MEQIIVVSGVAKSITPWPGTGTIIKSVAFDMPLDELGTTDPYINISGISTGKTVLHSSNAIEIKFLKGETVNVSGVNFGPSYSAIVKFTRYGEMDGYMSLNRSGSAIPRPWYFR